MLGENDMKKPIFTTKTIVAIGIGAAIFFILARYIPIPTGIPNTTFNLGYAILALLSTIFGPIAGLFIGLIGHTLTDLSWGYGVWWSWVIVSAIVGLLIGLFNKFYDVSDGEFGKKKIVTFNITQVIINAVGWMVIAPVLDILIYAEPANKVFLQGVTAGLLNIVVVGVLGTILLTAYAKSRTKKGSLSYEE